LVPHGMVQTILAKKSSFPPQKIIGQKNHKRTLCTGPFSYGPQFSINICLIIKNNL